MLNPLAKVYYPPTEEFVRERKTNENEINEQEYDRDDKERKDTKQEDIHKNKNGKTDTKTK